MSDLSEYDKAIVEAAEAYIHDPKAGTEIPLALAVQAKLKAQRLQWHCWCGKEASQTVTATFVGGARTEGFCTDHRVTVTDL